MKKINKLLLPLATLVMGSSIVAPLITSCANNKTDEGEEEVVIPEVELTDVNHGYIPEMEKHEPSTSLSKYEAKVEYLKALKENPNIATEDYKNFIGQLPEFLRYLQYDSEQMYPSYYSYKSNSPWTHTLNGLKAGLRDFEVKNNGLVSFTSGIETNFNLDINTDYNSGYYDPTQILPIGDFAEKIHIDADLSVSTSFKNFTLDLKSGKSVYDVPYSVITPVWPSDLNQRDWSLSIALKGSFVVYINNIKVLNLQNIEFKKKFDYRDKWILSYVSLVELFKQPTSGTKIPTGIEKQLSPESAISGQVPTYIGQTSSPFRYIGTDVYLMDVLTYLGTYTSYYMSDVMIKDTFKMVDKPVFVPCTQEDYRLAGWEDYDDYQGNSRLMDNFRYYKGRIVFQLPSEYSSISAVNNSYRFVPRNYNTYDYYGSSNPDASYASIIRPYSLPFGGSLSNPDSFPFQEYYDETGKLVKDKVYVDVWFSPVYNGISTRATDTKKDTGGVPGVVVNFDTKTDPVSPFKLQSKNNALDGDMDITQKLVDYGDRIITSLNENALTLDFVIREMNSDDSYLSVETHSEDYILDKELVEYVPSTAESDALADYEVFYIPQELSKFYELWKTMDDNWYENSYAEELGRYEGCTFSINVKIDSEAATAPTKPLRPNSKFMFGNWAIYDIQNNAAFDEDAILSPPSVIDQAGDPKFYPDARIAELYLIYNYDNILYDYNQKWIDNHFPHLKDISTNESEAMEYYFEKLLSERIVTPYYAQSCFDAYVSWVETAPSDNLLNVNRTAWTQYYNLLLSQSTTYSTSWNWQYGNRREYQYSYPFEGLQMFKSRFENDEYLMRGKMDVKSVTLDGKPFSYEIKDQEITFKNAQDIKKGDLNITFAYTGPTDTMFYYSVAYQTVQYWAAYMDYVNSVWTLQQIEDGSTDPIYTVLVPTDVYFYSVPFLAIAKEAQP